MDSTESDIYDYDRSSFFRLLQSPKFRLMYEFVQHQQGLVVCPLKAISRAADTLIESHLFVPSPFYKNVFIPLKSLSALSNLKPLLSLPLDHSQQISLVFDDSAELIVFYHRQRICRAVKLLSVQTAYTDTNQAYKILIVNKELSFKTLNYSQDLKTKQIEPPIYTEYVDNNQIIEDENQIEKISDLSQSNFIQEEVYFSSLKDVKTFGQSVDFMHSSSYVDEDEEVMMGEKRSIGEDLINEVELMRKTCIVLSTHLADCEARMEGIYVKYVERFLGAACTRLEKDSSAYAEVDLMVAVACENTVVGVLFSKLWPCLLQFNSKEDSVIQIKCDRIRKFLNLNQASSLSSETVSLCTRFFNIESKYFLINTQPVLREFKRLSLLNNPFERLDCIKTSVELVTNELALLNNNTSDNNSTSTVITSDVLIPLIAFILVCSDIGCFKSICYFIDRFQFSARANSISNSHCSSRLDELAFFMTTFKAAVQFIETS